MAIPVVSSVWDEALLLLCIVWLIWERKKAPSAISPKLNPLDFPVAIFLTVCFVLLCVVCPYLSIQIAGFRATCQYLLWFYLVTRLIRNDRDCMTLYLTLVALSFVLSLHGIYQYITKAPMPASWVGGDGSAHKSLLDLRQPQHHGRLHGHVRSDDGSARLLRGKAEI